MRLVLILLGVHHAVMLLGSTQLESHRKANIVIHAVILTMICAALVWG